VGKPEEAALAGQRMNALGARIARLIAAQGPITVAQYMTIALHDREYGYYATRNPIGADGDFTTAPEISQMFGELVGLWCAQAWHDQGKPSRARLVELGPGRGTLMSDALRAAKMMPEFLKAIEVTLVESNPALAALQNEKLKEATVPIAWAENCDAQLFDRPVFLIANEFFDALPIRQLVRGGKGWNERMLSVNTKGEFEVVLSPVAADALVPEDRRADAPDGGVYEFSDAAVALVREIAHGVASKGGSALIIDYGYDEPDFGETLQAVANQQFVDVLDAPGEADLSAHVDFDALAEAAENEGASAFGPINQRDFLVTLGIGSRASVLAQTAQGKEASASIQDDLDRLIGPDQMGELFKALAILPPNAPQPAGF
jgi:NADH dehydrogenase [ubiquinone] 1 alpha subcomplex assembly factor 7